MCEYVFPYHSACLGLAGIVALVVGFHDIWEARETKWLFAIPVVMGFVYCWGAIPLNGVLPPFWKLALAQLGLLREWTPP